MVGARAVTPGAPCPRLYMTTLFDVSRRAAACDTRRRLGLSEITELVNDGQNWIMLFFFSLFFAAAIFGE